jgi:hypothetical protein
MAGSFTTENVMKNTIPNDDFLYDKLYCDRFYGCPAKPASNNSPLLWFPTTGLVVDNEIRLIFEIDAS